MHFHIRNDEDFDDDDAMGHGVCQIMTFVDGGGWGSGKTQNKMTSFMNSALSFSSNEVPAPAYRDSTIHTYRDYGNNTESLCINLESHEKFQFLKIVILFLKMKQVFRQFFSPSLLVLSQK